MAPLAIVAAVVAAAGEIVSSIANSNALRSQAKARKEEGAQALLSSKRQLDQELGQSLVGAGASGLLGSSFAGVFDSQAIEDAEFLGRIKQRTDFDVASLKQQARQTLLTGIFLAGSGASKSLIGAKSGQEQVGAARREAGRQGEARAGQRNIFKSGATGVGAFGQRLPSSAVFF